MSRCPELIAPGHQRARMGGAGGGMGRDAALLFSEEGASVCVADVDLAAAEETASEAREAFAVEVDVAGRPRPLRRRRLYRRHRHACLQSR